MAGEDHGASNEERDRVRCRCCGVRWEEHEPDPDRAPCIRHGIVPLQGKILRLEAEVAAQKVAIATLQARELPDQDSLPDPDSLAGRLRRDMIAAGVLPAARRTAGEIASGSKAAPEFTMKPSTKVPPYLQPAGGKVLGMDFKEDWLPTPDDAGYYRYADGSFIRPSRRFPGEWTVGGDVGDKVLPPSFVSPKAAAEHLKALGMGPAAEYERSVDDGRREEEGEGRGQGGPGRGRDEGGAGGGGCPGG